jgi:hypothetical protein
VKPFAQARWLRAWGCCLLGLVGALLLADVLHWRPGYSVGDETLQMRLLLLAHEGGPLHIRLLQGSLQRLVMQAWLGLVPFRLNVLHWPGLAAFALELLLLFRLAKRWADSRVAWGALIFVLASATTWIRARSLLSFHWVPFFLLLVAHAMLAVRSRPRAILTGLAASLLLLDYEAGVLALPFVAWACAEREPALRRQLPWLLLGFVLGAAALAVWQWPVLRAYGATRAAVNAGAFKPGLFGAWLKNLSGLFFGAHPLAYVGVDAWPALAPWAWVPLALGAVVVVRERHWGLLAWPLAIIAITQLSLAPWGLSPHRLSAAWPALAIWAGLGLLRLLEQLDRKAWIVLLLLPLGFLGELHAWARHMGANGPAFYGRASRLQEACDELDALSAKNQIPVLSALYELRYPELRWTRRPSPAPAKAPSVYMLLPPDYRAAAERLPLEHKVWQESLQEQPVCAVRASGPLAARFLALDASLRPLTAELPVEAGRREDRAWLRAGKRDPWARDAVLARDLSRLWLGAEMDEDLMRLYAAQAEVQPQPPTLLGKYLITRDSVRAQQMLDRALALDPDYTPALEQKAKAFEAQGDSAAAVARATWHARVQAGAWQVYE